MSVQRATIHCQRCGVNYQADLPEPRCEFCGCPQPIVQLAQPAREDHDPAWHQRARRALRPT